MSSALTFYFKEIFPTETSFITYLNDYLIFDTTSAIDLTFAQYVYKILYRKYHNSNVQYDTKDDFKSELANVLEDTMKKYQKELKIIDDLMALTKDDYERLSTAIANQSNNPNTKPTDINAPLEYISAQAYTFAKDNKLQAYLRALETVPTKLIDSMLARCKNLFKTIIPKQIFVYTEED